MFVPAAAAGKCFCVYFDYAFSILYIIVDKVRIYETEQQPATAHKDQQRHTTYP